jgi:hypothetical protein
MSTRGLTLANYLNEFSPTQRRSCWDTITRIACLARPRGCVIIRTLRTAVPRPPHSYIRARTDGHHVKTRPILRRIRPTTRDRKCREMSGVGESPAHVPRATLPTGASPTSAAHSPAPSQLKTPGMCPPSGRRAHPPCRSRRRAAVSASRPSHGRNRTSLTRRPNAKTRSQSPPPSPGISDPTAKAGGLPATPHRRPGFGAD